MTVIKKCISFGLVFVMLLSTVGAWAFVGENEPLDRKTAAIEFMKGFGMLPDELLTDETPANITRAQAAYALATVTGTLSTDNGDFFKDVAEDSIYKDDIYSVYNYGLMNGTDERVFSPDENLTYFQAMKVLLTLAGYEKVISAIDKTPFAYENYCKRLKMLKNVSYVNVNDDISFTDFANMLYNTLGIAYCDISHINGDNIGFSNTDGTVMEHLMHIEKLEGILQTVGNSRISYSHTTAPNIIKVSSVSYKNGYDAAKRYLGANVYVYVDEAKKAVYVEPVNADYGYKSIEAEDIEAIGRSEIKYYNKKSDSSATYRLLYTADILVNGMPLVSGVSDYSTLIPDYGYVELFDYDCDNVYEVVSIHSYDLYYAETVSEGKEPVIIDKYTKNTLKLSDSQVNVSVSIEKDGKPITLEYVEAGMVILAEVSEVQENNRLINLYVSDAQLACDGGFSYGKDEVKMDGVTYKINPHYADAINNSKYAQSIDPASNKVFLLDSNGYVAAALNKEEVLNYGYLYRAGFESKALGSKLLLRILETNNEFKTYKTTEKINLNGTVVRADSLAGNQALFSTATATNTNQGVVRYSVNDEGLINRFYTVGGTDGYGKLKLDRTAADRRVRNLVFVDPDFIAADFYATSSIIFNVPDTRDASNVSLTGSEANFSCVDGSNIHNDNTMKNVSAYNVDELGYADVVVLSTAIVYKQNYYPLIVESVYNSYDEESGETRHVASVYGYTASKTNEVEVSETLEASKGDLKMGDVLIPVYSPDSKELADFTRVFTYTEGMAPYSGGTVTSSPAYGCGKYISSNGTKYMCLDWERDINGDGFIDSDDQRYIPLSSNTQYFVYDVKNETIKKGSASDLVHGDKVFYYLMNFSPLFMTIIKD